jgi:hypothetical protein
VIDREKSGVDPESLDGILRTTSATEIYQKQM